MLRDRLSSRNVLPKQLDILEGETVVCSGADHLRLVFFFFFFFFRTMPAAYGGSQTRGPIGAAGL